MKRLAYIDQISGLMICYMIVYHALQFCDMRDLNQSYLMRTLAFFMFWFFYKSGMFYKEKGTKEILHDGCKKLMVPFAVFSLLGHLSMIIHMYVSGDHWWVHYILSPIKSLLLNGAVEGNIPLWFLPSLLCVQLLYAFMHPKMRDEWICLLNIGVAYLTFKLDLHYPTYIGNVALGLFAYSIGHRLKDVQYSRKLFIIATVSYLTIYFIQPYSIDLRVNYLFMGYYPLAVLFNLFGCVLINNLFKTISGHFRLLEYVGVRSMSFYVMHWFVLNVCLWTFNLSHWALFSIIIISCIIVLPLLDKMIYALKLEWILGIKRK